MTRSEPAARALEDLAALTVERARRAGADHADVALDRVRAFTVRVADGAIESLKQATTQGLGVRVFVRGAVGFASTNDLRPEALDDLARRAVGLARFATTDPANALPDPADAPAANGVADLGLEDPAVAAYPPQAAIDLALALERAALGHDPRIRRTDGARVGSRLATAVLANSDGLLRSWRETAISMSVMPLADDGAGKQQTGYRSIARRRLADLPPAETVAREAAARAVARIGARPVAAARVPVVFHPDIGAAWLADMHDAFSAAAVVRQASWLSGRLGETIAAPRVTLVDDGRLPGGLASAPFDGEGVPTRRNVLIDRGRCAAFLYDAYHAHRTGARPTGSAVRSYASLPGIGAYNLSLEPGEATPEAILARVDRGFYMDDQGSFGFNPVTGDYSYQAQGFWIEKGERAFPVEGVTVAGRSLEMLAGVEGVGNDLAFDHAIACPTLLIGEMTVAGGG